MKDKEEEEGIEEGEYIDLTEELKGPTPKVSISLENSFSDEEDEELPDTNDDDDETEEQDTPLSKSEARTLAKQLVDDFSFVQKSFFESLIYPKTILLKGDGLLIKEYQDGIRSSTHEAAVLRQLELKQKIKELPFSKEEKDQLIKPLTAVIIKYQGSMKLGPEYSLVLALVLIMLGRCSPLIDKIFNKTNTQ